MIGVLIRYYVEKLDFRNKLPEVRTERDEGDARDSEWI
jgi:hypothetical protein